MGTPSKVSKSIALLERNKYVGCIHWAYHPIATIVAFFEVPQSLVPMERRNICDLWERDVSKCFLTLDFTKNCAKEKGIDGER